MDIQQNISNFIQAYKRQKGLTTLELADELGISHSSLSDYLSGRRNIRTDTISQIAKALHISPSALVSGGPVAARDYELALTLLDTLEAFQALQEERRNEAAELFVQLIKLWDSDT